MATVVMKSYDKFKLILHTPQPRSMDYIRELRVKKKNLECN